MCIAEASGVLEVSWSGSVYLVLVVAGSDSLL